MTIALDLSYACTGIAIDLPNAVQLSILTQADYNPVQGIRNKYEAMLINANKIADALICRLMPYRHEQFHIVIEEVAFGFNARQTNSHYQLLFEGAIVATRLMHCFDATVQFIAPKVHKKAFTGKGNADKALSVACMLRLFPEMQKLHCKLDDMADALAMLTTVRPEAWHKPLQLLPGMYY